MPRFLMSPPDYYGIEYEINPWMDIKRQATKERAREQWTSLYNALLGLPDVEVELVEPSPGLPDMVFTANAGVVSGNRFVSSRFRPPQRRGEIPVYENWFVDHGFELLRLPKEVYFEGEGDALRAGDTWFEGYYFRSDALAHVALSELLGAQVLPLRLLDPRFYHLDTCFCPLAPEQAIIYPLAFDEYALRVLRTHFRDLLEVGPDEANHFCCNAVVVGKTVITATGCSELHRALEGRGFEPIALDLDEFIKAGGAAKCLVLRIG